MQVLLAGDSGSDERSVAVERGASAGGGEHRPAWSPVRHFTSDRPGGRVLAGAQRRQYARLQRHAASRADEHGGGRRVDAMACPPREWSSRPAPAKRHRSSRSTSSSASTVDIHSVDSARQSPPLLLQTPEPSPDNTIVRPALLKSQRHRRPQPANGPPITARPARSRASWQSGNLPVLCLVSMRPHASLQMRKILECRQSRPRGLFSCRRPPRP